MWAASSALVGESCGKPVQREEGQEVPCRALGTAQERLCLGSSVQTAQRWVAALKQGPAKQAGFSQLRVCAGGHRSPPGRSGARPHGRCFIMTPGNPHHSQRPGRVADEEPEARRGRVGPGPWVSTVTVCVWPWVTAPVAPRQRHWSPGDEETQGSFRSSTHVCLQPPRAPETTTDTTPWHRPGEEGPSGHRVERSAAQLEDKSCVSPSPCSELGEAPCMPRPDRAS